MFILKSGVKSCLRLNVAMTFCFSYKIEMSSFLRPQTSVQINKLFESKIAIIFLSISSNMFFVCSKELSH